MELTLEALLLATGLFLLRVINYSISTIRLVFISRGRRILAAVMAFLEAFIFAVVMASVITEINNISNLLAYCLGAAVGSYVGMWLEARFVVSYSTVTIIAQKKGKLITDKLREHRYAVTVTYGEGREGAVTILRSSTISRNVPALTALVKSVNPDAFIEVETVRNLQRGWVPGGPPRRG